MRNIGLQQQKNAITVNNAACHNEMSSLFTILWHEMLTALKISAVMKMYSIALSILAPWRIIYTQVSFYKRFSVAKVSKRDNEHASTHLLVPLANQTVKNGKIRPDSEQDEETIDLCQMCPSLNYWRGSYDRDDFRPFWTATTWCLRISLHTANF